MRPWGAVKPADLLFTQGFGTRRACAALVAHGLLEIDGLGVVDDPARELDPDGLWFRVGGGARWPVPRARVRRPPQAGGPRVLAEAAPPSSVYALLPAPLRARGVQAIGRLDEDTTGVLLFTDDGALLHRLTSPKHHVAKVYEVRCRHAVDAAQLERLRAGVLLRDEHETIRAAACEQTGEQTLRLTLTEGKYHQVKRMIAAAGNRVEALERSAFGGVTLDGLAVGAWRWADHDAVAS